MSNPIRYSSRWVARCCFCNLERPGNEPNWLIFDYTKGFVCFMCQREVQAHMDRFMIGGHPAEVLNTTISMPVNPGVDPGQIIPELYDVVGTRVRLNQVVSWPVHRSSSLEVHVGTISGIFLDKDKKLTVQVWLWLVDGKMLGKYVRLTAGLHRLTVCPISAEELSRRIAGGKLARGW